MIRIREIKSVVDYLSLALAYILAAPLAGYFEAWVAKQFGDDTAEEQGYLTLNPLVHIDPLGMLFFILTRFGWFKLTPINPNRISPKYKNIKVVLVYLSGVFANFCLALLAMIVLAYLLQVLVADGVSMVTPRTRVIIHLIENFININVIFMIIRLVFNIASMLRYFYLSDERTAEIDSTTFYILLILPLIFMIAFGHYIEWFIRIALYKVTQLIIQI